jgi:hypothetical protein
MLSRNSYSPLSPAMSEPISKKNGAKARKNRFVTDLIAINGGRHLVQGPQEPGLHKLCGKETG